jgi:hypothetical protein
VANYLLENGLEIYALPWRKESAGKRNSIQVFKRSEAKFELAMCRILSGRAVSPDAAEANIWYGSLN